MTEPAFDDLTTEQKRQQFNEYFLIKHELNVNIIPVDLESLPNPNKLEEHMPYAFKIAGEMASIEAQSLRPLRNLSSHAADLAEFLNAQARKIDLMMSFILHQQDEETARYSTLRFGGGGIEVLTGQPFEVGSHVELKIFLTEEAAAVYCFAEVITCDEHPDGYHSAFIFSRIRDVDQELLVRASLHLQTQQLRKRSESNNPE